MSANETPDALTAAVLAGLRDNNITKMIFNDMNWDDPAGALKATINPSNYAAEPFKHKKYGTEEVIGRFEIFSKGQLFPVSYAVSAVSLHQEEGEQAPGASVRVWWLREQTSPEKAKEVVSRVERLLCPANRPRGKLTLYAEDGSDLMGCDLLFFKNEKEKGKIEIPLTFIAASTGYKSHALSSLPPSGIIGAAADFSKMKVLRSFDATKPYEPLDDEAVFSLSSRRKKRRFNA